MRADCFLILPLMARALALPKGRLVVGYATSRSLREDSVVKAVEHGVNVVIFAFAHLELDGDGRPRVAPTFDVDAARDALTRARAHGDVAALCAFGGWNGPHPSTELSGAAWYDCWRAWNDGLGGLFDGVDWDLEGHDDPAAPTTALGAATAALVADFSKKAKADAYAVFLAPAESYLDAASPAYAEALNNEPLAAWDAATTPGFPAAGFPYAGRNAYAAVVDRAGVETFDLISVQLYEGYSRACHATTVGGASLADYVAAAARALARGFPVDLPGGRSTIAIPPERLAFGFANGWADGEKFLRADPADVAAAFRALAADRLEPRGVMFWVIDEEGADGRPYFARDLARAFAGDGEL